MKCENCKYRNEGTHDVCDITHRVLNHPYGKQINGCTLDSDEDVEKMDICYNCMHWIGGGDWGLSCRKDYYNTGTNGFEVCDMFERKVR